MSAARENGCKLKSRFGEESWKVALEPECPERKQESMRQ